MRGWVVLCGRCFCRLFSFCLFVLFLFDFLTFRLLCLLFSSFPSLFVCVARSLFVVCCLLFVIVIHTLRHGLICEFVNL